MASIPETLEFEDLSLSSKVCIVATGRILQEGVSGKQSGHFVQFHCV